METLSPRRRRRRRQRAEEILEAAESLLARGGLDAVTIHGIAAELDWAQGALYRYFPSKDALLAALQRRVLDRLGRRMQAGLDALDPDAPPLSGVLRIADIYHRFAEQDAPSFHLLTQSIADPREWVAPSESANVVDAAEELFAQLADQLRLAAHAGALTPGDDAARAVQLWASLHGVLQLRKIARLRPRRFPVDHLARGTVDSLLIGWGATADVLAAARAAVDSSLFKDVPDCSGGAT